MVSQSMLESPFSKVAEDYLSSVPDKNKTRTRITSY
jgi:hypothetical protein